MARGYPGKGRARKAFWRGVKSLRYRKPNNPYRHPRLRELFERGRVEAQLKPALLERVPIRGNRPQRRLEPRQERSNRNAQRPGPAWSVPPRDEFRRRQFR